jgi:hypothetical protein
MDFFELEISGLKASHMNQGNLLSYSPYVKVFVGDSGPGRTEIMIRTENPEWKDKLTFNVPQISNTFVVFKVYDAVIIGEDTLLGFVEVPIRLENAVNAELSDISQLRDGVGTLEYKIKCTQLPLASLSTVSSGASAAVEKCTQLGLYRSLLPRNTRSIFIREFENCALSRQYSNFFAIDAVRDFEDLFTISGHTLSSTHGNHAEDRLWEQSDDALINEQISPFMIDGRVEGSVVSVVLPPPVALKLDDESSEEADPFSTLVRVRTRYGEVTEKIVSVDTNRGSLNLPWHDLICTDRLITDGIVIDIVSVPNDAPTQKKESKPVTEDKNDSKGLGASKIICRTHFSYMELIESGKGSTGVDGEVILDNKLRMRPCPTRVFDMAIVGGGATANGNSSDSWSIVHVAASISAEDMKAKLLEPKAHHYTREPPPKPFEWMAAPAFQISSRTCGLKAPREHYPKLTRPPVLSSRLPPRQISESSIDDYLGEERKGPELAFIYHTPNQASDVGHQVTPPVKRLPPPLPPLPPPSPPTSPPPSGISEAAENSPEEGTAAPRRLPPPLPPLPIANSSDEEDEEVEVAAEQIPTTTKRLPPPLPPLPPPDSPEYLHVATLLPAASTSRRPSFTPVPPPSDVPTTAASDIPVERKGPPPLPPLPPPSPTSSEQEQQDANEDTDEVPGDEKASDGDGDGRESGGQVRMHWSSSSEEEDSEADAMYAQWTEVIQDDYSDSSESSSGAERIKKFRVVEREAEACLTEYLIVELRRDAGNLLMGWQSKGAASAPAESPTTRDADIRASVSILGANDGLVNGKHYASRSKHIRIAVPLPARMLSAQCLMEEAPAPIVLKMTLPRPPGSSSVDDSILTITCKATVPESQERNSSSKSPQKSSHKSTSSPSYGVHLRWTVANPPQHMFTSSNTCRLNSAAINTAIFREGSVGTSAFSMMYGCIDTEHRESTDEDDDAASSRTALLVDLAPSKLRIYNKSMKGWTIQKGNSSSPRIPAALGDVTTSEDEEGGVSMCAVPSVLSARIFEKPKAPDRVIMKLPSDDTADDNTVDASAEESLARDSGLAVDMTKFLRSDETPFGFTLSVDVYENQFMLVPRSGASRGVTLRGQRWMPLGARSAASSGGYATSGQFSLGSSKEVSMFHTFSDVSGEEEFPTYASLVPAADSDGLLSKTHSISDDVIDMDGFEVSTEWVLVKAFGSKGTGYEVNTEVHEEAEDDYDDLGVDDGECWWYAATLENLLTNTACYQSYYPGCLYRRRCWRKYLRHKVSSLLRFEDIHRRMKPLRHHDKLAVDTTTGTNRAVLASSSPRYVDSSACWEYDWEAVTDCLIISESSVAFTVKTDISNNFGEFETRSFVVSPCNAKRLCDIINLRRQLTSARSLIERNVLPVIKSGRNLFHCNRIDSCGFMSTVADVRQDVIDQRAIQHTMSKLREIIQDTTIAMIPMTNKRSQSMLLSSQQEDCISCDFEAYRTDISFNLLPPAQPVPLTMRYPDSSESIVVSPAVDLVFLVLERLVGYYRLISGYTKLGNAISKTPLKLSLTPTITATATIPQRKNKYSPSGSFLNDKTVAEDAMVVAEEVEGRGTLWKLQGGEEEVFNETISAAVVYTRPEYTVKDTLVYITKLMSAAVDGILCTQKVASLAGADADAEAATQRYLKTLRNYANDCVCNIVSVIRSLIAWNDPDIISSKAGPWADGFLPLTTFIVRNNPRLMLTLLAVTTTAPFGVTKVPCFSRYTGIRSLIHWELQPRARSLYTWVKSLRKGGLKYILEVCLIMLHGPDTIAK